MKEIVIRELQSDDIEECIEMTVTTFPWSSFGLKRESARVFFKERLDKSLIYVAEHVNEVAGFIAVKRDILFANYIRRLVVREDKRGLGIGRKLVEYVEELTREEGLPNVFLMTSITNEKAVAFYIKLGYEIIGKIPDFIKRGMDEYLLWKSFGTVNEFQKYE